MATTQLAARDLHERAMPPLRSISSRMIGILSSSSAPLRSEEEETASSSASLLSEEEETASSITTSRGSSTATASEICKRALRVSAHQEEEQHQSRRSSQRHRRSSRSSILSTRSSKGEGRRRSSLFSVGSNILSDLSSVADDVMSSLALEAADTTATLECDQPSPTRPPATTTTTTTTSSSTKILNDRNDDEKEVGNDPTATSSRPKSRHASFHYRRSSCSSMRSIDSEKDEILHRHQVFLQTTRRRHSSLYMYDIDDDHENVDAGGNDMANEEVSHASDVEDIVIHRPRTSLASNDTQESVRDLDFFQDDQFVVVDGLVTLSSIPSNCVVSRAG